MYSALKIFNCRQKSENGFVLVIALMAVVIIIAAGFFILTTTTQDILISSRLVGERKAMSAAESGTQAILASTLTVDNLTTHSETGTQVDNTNDPTTTYSYPNTIKTGRQIYLSGSCTGCLSTVYTTTVTGADSKYNSSVSIGIGIAPPGTPGDTTSSPPSGG